MHDIFHSTHAEKIHQRDIDVRKNEGEVTVITSESRENKRCWNEIIAFTQFFSRKAIRKTHAVPLNAEIYMANEAMVFLQKNINDEYTNMIERRRCSFISRLDIAARLIRR